MTKLPIKQQIKNEEDYIKFLEKRLASENYKKNVSKEEYNLTKLKLDKARFKLRTLKK